MSVPADMSTSIYEVGADKSQDYKPAHDLQESISQPQEFLSRKFVVPLKHFAGLYVRVRFDDLLEKKMLFPKGSLYIGAAAYNDISVRGVDIKDRHVHIYVDNGIAHAETLETGAEVLVNGETCSGTSVLKKGDVISLGNIDIALIRGA